MAAKTKELNAELKALYKEVVRTLSDNVSGIWAGDLTIVIVRREHSSPNIYFYDFQNLRSPVAEIGYDGVSLVLRPYSKKGHHTDVYLSEETVLREMRVLPDLIKRRIAEVQGLELGVRPEHVHIFTDPDYIAPPQRKARKKK